MSDLRYGFIENVTQGFNVSPGDAEGAIREAYEIAGGRVPFEWFARESRRLKERFVDPEEMATEAELALLAELARRADGGGYVKATRDELATAMNWPHRQLGNALTWGEWRESFSVRRTSSKSEPPAYRIKLRHWPMSRGPKTSGVRPG